MDVCKRAAPHHANTPTAHVPLLVNGLRQSTRGLTSTVGLHAVPEESVVPHLGSIVEHTTSRRLADNVLQRQSLKPGAKSTIGKIKERKTNAFLLGALDETVDVGNVSSVVLVVMIVHG